MALSGWNPNNKLQLTLDGSKIDTDLTNFPVNITLSSVTGINGFDATAVFDELIIISGTKNIAITDTNDNQCYVEIERWDWANEEANLWVKVPTIVSGTDTTLYLYYDATVSENTTYVGDTGDSPAQNVWDGNFVGVWHMAQDPNGDVADAIKDSTSNTNHGTPAGTMLTEDFVEGKIGKAIAFDGAGASDDRIVIADDNSLDITIFTLETIIKPTSVSSAFEVSQHLFYASGSDNGGYALDCAAGGEYGIHCLNDGVASVKFTDGEENAWKYITGTYDDTDIKIYIDGILKNTNNAGASKVNPTQGVPALIGHSISSIPGIADEIRLSNIARSAAWIKATYYSNWDDFIVFQEEAPTTTWLTGWANRLQLTIDYTKINNILIEFPVNITLSSGTGITGFDATAVFDELGSDANRKKIAITDSDDNQCYVEIERWDWANEEANLWTKVPIVRSDEDTILYLYYDATVSGNTTYVGDTGEAAAQAVWDSNFLAVWHMAQDPDGDGADAIKDSTDNTNDGTPDGTMLTEDLVEGMIGKAIDFDGSDDHVGFGDVLDFDKDDPLTFEVCTNADEGGATIFVIAKEDNFVNAAGYHLTYAAAGSAQFSLRSDQSTDIISVVGTANVRGSWHYVAATYDGSLANTGLNMYENGAPNTDTRSGGPLTDSTLTNELFQFGCREGCQANHYIGILDEVRISNIDRSAAWIKATYYSNWDDLIICSIEVSPTYYYEGYITEQGNPVSREVKLYYRSTGELIDSTTSSGVDGYYYLTTIISGTHFVVAFDDDAGEDYNALILDKLLPVGLE